MEETFDLSCDNSECRAVQKKLLPPTPGLNNVPEGDIFAFRTYDI